MIVWSGWGFLGALIPITVGLLLNLLVDAIRGKGYVAAHNWPIGVGLLISAALVFLVGQRLDAPARTLVDPASGQAVVLQRRHTLFFLKLKWIALILAAVGLYFALLAPSDSPLQPAPATKTLLWHAKGSV